MKKSGKYVGILCVLVLGWVLARRLGLEHPYRHERRLHPGLKLNGFTLSEAGPGLGVDFVHREPPLDPRLLPYKRMFFYGSGAAAADVDGDGWTDLLLLSQERNSPNRLYLNRQGRGFTDAAAAWGLASTNQEGANVSALFFDADNDGRPDLLLSRLGCLKFFVNTGRGFQERGAASGLGDCGNAMAALALDVDRDGLLDVYVMRYWPRKDYTGLASFEGIVPENTTDARNGGRNSVYRNLGGGRFQDMTSAWGGDNLGRWCLDGVAADLDDSGGSLLYLANDFGPDALYEVSPSGFKDVSGRLGTPDRRYGMGASLADLDHDGIPHVFVTNEYERYYNQNGNFLWKFARRGPAVDQARRRGLVNSEWSWGAAFSDYTVSGEQDLYVANGFISGDPEAKDGAFQMGTYMALPGVLRTGEKMVPRSDRFDYFGHMVDYVFHNAGGRFEDVALDAGISRDWDGRAAVLVDFDNDGAQDLLVTTQSGPAHLFRNTAAAGDHWVGFHLRGTRSNRDGTGARLKVSQGGRDWYRWAVGGRTGFLACSDPRLHVGLPAGGSVDVEVRWPSGRVQSLRGLPCGRYHEIQEVP